MQFLYYKLQRFLTAVMADKVTEVLAMAIYQVLCNCLLRWIVFHSISDGDECNNADIIFTSPGKVAVAM